MRVPFGSPFGEAPIHLHKLYCTSAIRGPRTSIGSSKSSASIRFPIKTTPALGFGGSFLDCFTLFTHPVQTAANTYYATWTGISGDVYYRNGAGANTSMVTNEWLDANIRSKGPLGKAYPKFMFIMEGDTPSFLGLIDNGLNSFRRPDWGGWGGRYIYRQPYGESRSIWTQGGDTFSRVTSQDTVGIHVSDQATIWRWREAFQNDLPHAWIGPSTNTPTPITIRRWW